MVRMTRFLSEALQAPEPFFRLGLQRLEKASGNPSTDIRFTSEVKQSLAASLRGLQLDPSDTTPRELYHALQERIKQDDKQLTTTLRTRAATYISAEGNVIAGMEHALRELPDAKRCYALKASSLRVLLKKNAPKKAIKQLGYRSQVSFFKHETAVSMLTAAWLCEDDRWRNRLVEQYKQLQPSDFESRPITITQASFKRWHNLADSVVAHKKHNVLSFKELGAVVLLPYPAEVPAGAVTASLTLALQAMNDIRACSTFLKLAQVKSDFGSAVHMVVSDAAHLQSELLDRPVPWHLIQRYYAQMTHHFSESLFEPHIQLEDMVWHPIEASLVAIEPKLAFWRQTTHVGMQQAGKPVSLNILDAALNYCNQLPYEARIVKNYQHSLWHELLLRYLHPAAVERTIINELQPQLATELALA